MLLLQLEWVVYGELDFDSINFNKNTKEKTCHRWISLKVNSYYRGNFVYFSLNAYRIKYWTEFPVWFVKMICLCESTVVGISLLKTHTHTVLQIECISCKNIRRKCCCISTLQTSMQIEVVEPRSEVFFSICSRLGVNVCYRQTEKSRSAGKTHYFSTLKCPICKCKIINFWKPFPLVRSDSKHVCDTTIRNLLAEWNSVWYNNPTHVVCSVPDAFIFTLIVLFIPYR